MQSIRKNPYSLLIDESTDISVTKFLGIIVIYFDREMGKTISTYLTLVEITNCDAQSITDALKDAIKNKELQLKNLVGIETDNASVMVGVNNGVYQKLKLEIKSLILIPCVYHSLQLAVSSTASEALTRYIDFLIKETFNWFSHSTLRQSQYKDLYKAINNRHYPLKIVRACGTRWLSIETAVSIIVEQWLELKTLFGITRLKGETFI